jgi:hypothetical protein
MPRDLNLLTLPLRARLTREARYPMRPTYRPQNGFLLDERQPRLPSPPRRRPA